MFNNKYFELNLSKASLLGLVENYLEELCTLLVNFQDYLPKSTSYSAQISHNFSQMMEKIKGVGIFRRRIKWNSMGEKFHGIRAKQCLKKSQKKRIKGFQSCLLLELPS